jgi:type IV secretory pathway VirB4 component
MNYSLFLGERLDPNHELPEITSITDRFEHTYIVGKTGMGKSSLLEEMAYYDITKGAAVIFIDPKGKSSKKLLQLTEDKSRIHYISIESPLVINPLNKEDYKLDNLIQEFIQILDVLITLTASNPESTVLMREIIVMALKSIRKEKNKNIDYLTKFLLYYDVRKALKDELPINSDERMYWEAFDLKGKNTNKIECAQRVASRLIEISTGEMKDFVVGKNELDISHIVKNGKVVLVDTSRMNRNSRIYLSNLIVYAVLSYCEFAKKTDKPLLVYVDEFQIVVSSLFSDLLARSRDSMVGFTLAHQNFQQIPRDILGSVFGNVGTSICFRCGDEEARRFSPLFGIKAQDLFNLPKYNAWARIGIQNILIETYPPMLPKLPVTEIDIPGITKKQEEIQFKEIQVNFLNERWVKF